MQMILQGDVRERLADLPAGSVQCCVTSPPYFGLRDYGVDGQIGLEPTPAEYVEQIVGVFREVRRVLRDDGTVWLNLGDSYAANAATAKGRAGFESLRGSETPSLNREHQGRIAYRGDGVKAKDLLGIPWRVAFALQADGWYLRQDIIWHKPNPMPESVRDRCTKAHEYIFLLSKSERYFYDAEAISEPSLRAGEVIKYTGAQKNNEADSVLMATRPKGRDIEIKAERNRRSVWSIGSEPYPEAHFATFPTELPRLCILAGSKTGDTILDPFNGSGTTGQVALELGRQYVGIELNPAYVELTHKRLRRVTLGLPLEAA